MNSTRTLLRVLATFLGLSAGLYLPAREKAESHPPLHLSIDDKPVDRSASSRTSYATVVRKASPGVAYVFSSKKVRRSDMSEQYFDDPMFRHFFGLPDQGGNFLRRPSVQQSLGSGVIVTTDGYILTNNHVVEGADEVKVAFGEPRKEYVASIVGRDAKADIALLKVAATNLPAVTLGDSDRLEVGDTVLAIGNPFGVGMTVTHGIVSALRRGGLGIEDYEDFIQTDAPINPGNSGGALLDSEGRLIGINTAILSRTGGSNGVGFAIPVNQARAIMEQLVANGHVERGFLGVTTQALTEELGKSFNVEQGALVSEVKSGSAAEKAGLKPGDIITRVNDTIITDPRGLSLAISRLAPDSEVTIHYMRDGKDFTAKAKLGRQATQALAGEKEASGGDDGVLNGVGVTDLTAETRAQLRVPHDLQGALVSEVDPMSASAAAGLQQGDIILELDRQKVQNADEAVKLSGKIKGPKVLVLYWRQGARRFVVIDESR